MAPTKDAERLIGVIEGCQKLLARRGIHKEAFVLGYVMNGLLESMRAAHGDYAVFHEYERVMAYPVIFYYLKVYEGNQVRACASLGISRNTLRARLTEALSHPAIIRLAQEMGCEDYLPGARKVIRQVVYVDNRSVIQGR